MFVDTGDYTFSDIFDRYRIHSMNVKEYIKEGSKYRLITCWVLKKELSSFLIALEEIYRKILLIGDREYIDLCNQLIGYDNQ